MPLIALTHREIAESSDFGAREIFTQLPVSIALWARWSRLVVDLNRDPLARDPYGVVPECDYHNRRIYRENRLPSEDEVDRRLHKYYWPYHHRLREAMQSTEIKILFDCHSLAKIGPPAAPDSLRWRKDIVLGNGGDHRGEIDPSRGTITCPAETLHMASEAFQRSGFSVSINQPYSGGYITTHYGNTFAGDGKMAVQIEINQVLYFDEVTFQLRMDKLTPLIRRLQQVFREIANNL
jgi:N-formylglutamate amidohydrolase